MKYYLMKIGTPTTTKYQTDFTGFTYRLVKVNELVRNICDENGEDLLWLSSNPEQ